MKESLLYRVLRIPRTPADLLDKAEREGETRIDVVAEYSEVYETSRSTNHWTEVWVDVRYTHGKKERRVFLGRFDSRKGDYHRRHTILRRFETFIKINGF